MPRLLIVSNRLPVTVAKGPAGVEVQRSSGGLATGLAGPHSRSDALWIGWPGDVHELDEAERSDLVRRLEELRTVPVWLDPDEVKGFYEGYSNEILWPLFHYLIGQMPLVASGWQEYERVNRRFADAVAEHYRPGDLVWVHDYHLMLLPQMLRERIPDARIGFFLHIPFPAAEIFLAIPHRERILLGLLGADLVGFHTAAYMRAFSTSLLRILGIQSAVERVQHAGREVRLGTFPMGVDARKFAEWSEDPEVVRLVTEFRGDGQSRIVLGIDRLDYTKGIRRRLLAFERLLTDRPELRERVRLVQIAVPSRTSVGAYQEFRSEVEGLTGRINGAFGTPRWTPIQYMFRSVSERELVGLYRAADVMLVTPVRDGMNLVAKEFVASRTDEDGVLVLSEFAGAASELAEALLVNPYDVERTADTIYRALHLGDAERRRRMRALRRRVVSYDVHQWANSFLEMLEEASSHDQRLALAMTRPDELDRIVQRMRSTKRLVLILGYDGTLVPTAGVPDLSRPDEALLTLLERLAGRPGTAVHLVSGSSRDLVQERFGGLKIGLHAEYGFWSRPADGDEWTHREMPPLEWRELVLGMLDTFRARTPGSLIEEKTVSLAWHYRMSEPEFGAFQANELRTHLAQVLSNEPVEIVTDERVITLRPFGVNKASVVESVLRDLPPDALVFAMGNDRTDEELFAALPDDAVTVHVGMSPSRAQVRVADFAAARGILSALADEAPAAREKAPPAQGEPRVRAAAAGTPQQAGSES
jgi:trehalose 6-phosphate synthase/phosphatase